MPEDKTCGSCGRRIVWRRAYAKSWEELRYCSEACRRRKVTAFDARLEEELRRRLPAAGRSGVDPADVARDLAPDDRSQREPARRAARRLVAAGAAEMVQDGRVVDPSTARGAVRVRLT